MGLAKQFLRKTVTGIPCISSALYVLALWMHKINLLEVLVIWLLLHDEVIQVEWMVRDED